MSDSPTSDPEPAFVCDCKHWSHSACESEPFYRELEGKRYCVLHFPGNEKSEEFDKAMRRKIEGNDFDFNGVWFPPSVSFTNVRVNTYAHFDDATFSGDAYFLETQFADGASFVRATFHAEARFNASSFSLGASFVECTFNGYVDFRWVRFARAARFNRSAFNREADFSDATFDGEADFENVIFKDYIRIAKEGVSGSLGQEPSFDFQYARVDNPERFAFHTVTLRPNWFVNLDAREFDFTNVDWDWRSIAEEIDSLERKKVLWPHSMLSIACRHLAVNAEENHRYEEASKFRYMAMDARRRERWRGLAFWRLSWWYWLASGYGERVSQAFLVLLGILVLSAVLYTWVGFARWEPRLANESDVASAKRDNVGAPLEFRRAWGYSAGVITFQKPEPRPATSAAQTVVLLETILGPVQAALLALAIRRKFMR